MNYNTALKRMLSAEKLFQKKGCFRVVDEEVQELLEQNFVTNAPPEQIDYGKPEWYLPLQAMFMLVRTTKVSLESPRCTGSTVLERSSIHW